MKSMYVETVKLYHDFDLTQAGYFYDICPQDLSADLREKVGQIVDLYDEDDIIAVSAASLYETGVERYDLPMCNDYWEDEELEETLKGMIKETGYYLIFLSGNRWNGSSEYCLTRDIHRIVYRGYDITLYPEMVSAGGKTLICREFSHDVPMGSRTICVALTKTEYEKLLQADFKEVECFAKNLCEPIEEKWEGKKVAA